MKKPVYAIKFKNFCQNAGYSAAAIADMLDVTKSTVYKYYSGRIAVPDEAKKILESKLGLNIYEVFFNERFDNEMVTVKKGYLELLERHVR